MCSCAPSSLSRNGVRRFIAVITQEYVNQPTVIDRRSDNRERESLEGDKAFARLVRRALDALLRDIDSRMHDFYRKTRRNSLVDSPRVEISRVEIYVCSLSRARPPARLRSRKSEVRKVRNSISQSCRSAHTRSRVISQIRGRAAITHDEFFSTRETALITHPAECGISE